MAEIKQLNTVALLRDMPDYNLSKGQVGTVVEKLNKGIFEIEFTNSLGETILTTPLSARDLILLRFEPA
jgi:hypothetical protein